MARSRSSLNTPSVRPRSKKSLKKAKPVPPPAAAAAATEEPKKRRFKSSTYALRNIKKQQSDVKIPGIHAGRRRIFRRILQEAEAEVRNNPNIGVRYKRKAQDVADASISDVNLDILSLGYVFTVAGGRRKQTKTDITHAITAYAQLKPEWSSLIPDMLKLEKEFAASLSVSQNV